MTLTSGGHWLLRAACEAIVARFNIDLLVGLFLQLIRVQTSSHHQQSTQANKCILTPNASGVGFTLMVVLTIALSFVRRATFVLSPTNHRNRIGDREITVLEFAEH